MFKRIFRFPPLLRHFASSPSGTLRFTKDHEWVRVSGSTIHVGISDHAQHELGDVVYIELPEVGTKFKKGDAFGTVESVKATSSVFAPIGFEVVETNGTLLKDFALINRAPEGDGWMIKGKATNAKEIDGLLDDKQYHALVEREKGKH